LIPFPIIGDPRRLFSLEQAGGLSVPLAKRRMTEDYKRLLVRRCREMFRGGVPIHGRASARSCVEPGIGAHRRRRLEPMGAVGRPVAARAPVPQALQLQEELGLHL